MSHNETVAIVDDYGPKRRHAPFFKQAGFECVRVQSTQQIPAVYRSGYFQHGYVANIVHTGSVGDTVTKLAGHRPIAVVAGSEVGVELADALSEKLGLATNGTELSSARRDKFTMIEQLRLAGLRATDQLRITSERDLRAWHERRGGRIVLKPARSAAGDGVRFCQTPDESVTAYQSILGRSNIFAEPNESVVAQEYLVGDEYIVNTVSCEGAHHVCDIWRTVRVDVNGVLDALSGIYIVPRQGTEQDQLVAYAGLALDALGIRFGPAHVEIKLTPDGPCLVELGARIGGSDNPYYAELATGESQLTWTVDAYTNPERFLERDQEPYKVHEFFSSSVMLCPHKGILRSYPYLHEVERLESLHEIRTMIKCGEPITASVGGARHPMIVNLKHPIEEIVMRDMETLRYLDGYSFYEVS